ncbi:HAMP domain-containing histidine kinase [Acetobacterium wieringae]|uniref:histidine kinase n=1 Tax=Acetobacterium wieringae TaxID=52694 RepID=A0ABY6HCR0_9FIRM|nr:HAMP domain-containing sensor histidine kinase [Acetobacterium wieringae]UYO62279.1 HAMP domain-containing histidine kinase [Acetobacterium wieringae]
MKTARTSSPKKNSPLQISVKWKIFLFLLGFCGVLLMLLWFFQVVFLNSFYKGIKINEIKATASTIEKSINDENIETIISTVSENNDICIKVLSSSGETIYSSHVVKGCIIHSKPEFDEKALHTEVTDNNGELFQYYNHDGYNKETLPEAAPDSDPALSENSDVQTKPPAEEKEKEKDTLIYSKTIIDNNNQELTLVLNSMISPVNATVNTLRVQLYYITGFMILFSVILALVIARLISRPIEAINNSAKMLATGDYSTRFKGTGYKEIAELSDTLNYTARELSKVELLRQELIANISHDLRTPLTLISGYAEAMRDLPDENNAENAQIIVDETKRLTTLVNDVMDISKLQTGNLNIHPAPYNLTTSLCDSINRMNKLMEMEGYTIEFIADQEVNLSADETRISQAFYNLLTNAINYTGEDKKITVTQSIFPNPADDLTDWVKIEVCDTGEGIAEEDLPYIWDRYYKVDKTHKRAVTGTGLGLSIVKSILDMHHGDYGVTSKLNEGSVFWFTLKI